MTDHPRPWTNITEATLPPALRIPFDAWGPPRERRALAIPAAWLGFRSWLEIIDGSCQGIEARELRLGGGEWLLYAEKVGRDVIAAWTGRWATAALIRRGRVCRGAEIRMPAAFQLECDEWFVWSRLSAVRTAELAVLTLRERKAPGRKKPEAEAWLRRQLAGLGKETP